MAQLFFNNARGTLAGPVIDIDDTLVLRDHANLPTSLAVGDWFLVTVLNETSRYGSNIEIMKVTGVTASGSNLELVVERGQDGTTVIAHDEGAKAEARITRSSLVALLADSKDYTDTLGESVTTSLAGKLPNSHASDPDPHSQYLKEAEYEARISREALLKQATLSLDFANNKYEVYEGPVNSLTQMPFNTALDFTRTSAATATNAAGKMVDVGVGDQRLIGNREGLLIEEARTNLLSYPRHFTPVNPVTEWRTEGAGFSYETNAAIAPDGTLTAIEISSASQATSLLRQIVSGITDTEQTYTFSGYFKKGSSGYVTFRSIATGGTTQDRRMVFNFDNEEFVRNDYGLGRFKKFDDGWYRLDYRLTLNGTGQIALRMYVSGGVDDPSTQGSVYFWGGQIEEGSFPTSVIPDGTTFTSRASTATYIDATGTLQTAAIDVARDDAYGYVDGVLKPIGLLLEGAATNLLTYSEQFDNADWVKSRVTVEPDVVDGPFGELSATKLVESGESGEHFVEQAGLPTAAGTYTQSIYVKAGTIAKFALQVVHIGEATDTSYATFNASTGALVSLFGIAITSADSQKLASGWFRFSVTYTLTSAATDVRMRNYTGNRGSRVGDPANFVYFDKAQVEEGSYPTSYIPTQGTQVTRAADVSSSPQVTRAADSCVRMLGDEFNPDEFTSVISFHGIPKTSLASEHILALNGDAISADKPRVSMRLSPTNPFSVQVLTDGNGVWASQSIEGMLTAGANKVAVSVSQAEGSISIVVNGGLAFSAVGLNGSFNGITKQWISSHEYGATINLQNWNIYPTALSEAELIALTGGN